MAPPSAGRPPRYRGAGLGRIRLALANLEDAVTVAGQIAEKKLANAKAVEEDAAARIQTANEHAEQAATNASAAQSRLSALTSQVEGLRASAAKFLL